ncbi:hypothetical protein GALMADRAFT_129997 [Galerina marginata CBS 339.88]|uniref:EF-hand domain-containing protein n=1 Tax=Galerina marginata (strain CBS 339.88) TaxID=685588 RepID=A0A067SM12_GALM3|nr:hypothetical protein GALMADRAFT_129997 [Galerina marginata CBS 339.88]
MNHYTVTDTQYGPGDIPENAYQSTYAKNYTAKDAGALERAETDAHSDSVSPWKVFHEFYEANADLVSSRSRDLNGTDPKNIDDALNAFTETAQATVKGLQSLSQLHPFIAAAVGAFVLVITLDLTRRDNDRKVLAVKLQMQDLMSVFFELRHYRHSNERGKDGVSIAERLKGLMNTIAKDVKACGSACDAYLKKGFLAKTVKASTYETRLSDFVTQFEEHRRKLELAFTMHTSLGVDSANDKLDVQDHRLRAIEEKLDTIALFRKLDTPREKDVQKFIDEHGGVKACLNNDELLEELVAKSGESSSRISGRDTSRRSNDLPTIRKRLLKELMEDIDDVLTRNMVLFERKLDIQSKQLTETIQSESDHIIHTLLSGAHDRIIDPDLQKIWKDMGWKGSVKARHFVLALHDYYTDKLSKVTSETPTVDRGSLASIPSPRPPPRGAINAVFKRQDDKWALAYINAAYVQPILEAVDDDGTGFVSVKEVNTFVASRPDGWSLPHWIAYWAVGWQASISLYKNKIYSLVQTMFQTLEHVLPSNRRAVDEYLFHASFWRIELLLRSTRSVNPKIMQDPDLTRITELYSSAEEERINTNLQDVNYELDTPATVSLITGEGRIERYVFPLIYLLLRRHLKVINIACKHVVDTEEFSILNESLVSILLSIDYRVQNLEAVFKQTHLDVQARLGNFAFGIFQLSYGDIKRLPIQNSFGTWVDEDEGKTRGKELITLPIIKAKVAHIPLAILKYGIQDGFHSTDYYEFEPARLRRTAHAIQGTWTGHCSRTEGEEVITYVLRVSFRMSADHRKLKGKGEDFATTFELEGHVNKTRTGYTFEFSLVDDDDEFSKTGSGSLDVANDIITMSWSDRRKKENPDEPYYQPFQLRRTPPSLVRYRYTPHQFDEDPARSRWAFACGAALHQAQEKLWSRRFFQARFAERKRFVELTTRSLIVSMGLTPQKPLNPTESGELEYLRRELNPSEARFYQALSAFEIQKLPWHPSWGCDWCERRITKSRILCIQCMSEDLSDNIELCSACIDKAPTKRGFSHDMSHDMVKVEETLHDFYFAQVVESARTIISRVKGLFRAIESSADDLALSKESKPEEEERHEPICACCNKRVSTPCWACVVCTRDTFICTDCDSRRLRSLPDGPSPGHKLNHPLVRVRDSTVAGQNASTEERLTALQQRLLSMEHKMTAGLAAIDAKVDERLTNLENRVEQRLANFEAKAELRFDTMEALVRQLVAQTAALPSIYAQVVKEQIRTSMPASPASPRSWF